MSFAFGQSFLKVLSMCTVNLSLPILCNFVRPFRLYPRVQGPQYFQLLCTVHNNDKLQYPKKSHTKKRNLKHPKFFYLFFSFISCAIYFSIGNSMVCPFKRIKVIV